MWTLTNIVITFSLAKLLAQSEGSVALELLGELLRSVGSEGSGALPAQLVEGLGLACLIVLQLHHVQHVPLGLLRWDLATSVVRAHDVKVVIDADLYSVIVPQKTKGKKERKTTLREMPCQCFPVNVYWILLTTLIVQTHLGTKRAQAEKRNSKCTNK